MYDFVPTQSFSKITCEAFPNRSDNHTMYACDWHVILSPNSLILIEEIQSREDTAVRLVYSMPPTGNLRHCYAAATKEVVIGRLSRFYFPPANTIADCRGIMRPIPRLITRTAHLEVCALWRLRQLFVGRGGHVPSNLDQDGFHGEVALPLRYARKFGEVDLSQSS